MEFSEIFGFLKIFSRSIKLVLKNGKSMASITAVSLLLSSFLFSLFGFGYQSVVAYVTDSIINSTAVTNTTLILQIIACLSLLFSVEICFIFANIAITHASGIATIIAAAASYSDTKLSLRDLYSMVRTKWRSPFTKNYNLFRRSPGKGTHLLIIFAVAVAVAVPVVVFHPNPITIAIASVVGVSFVVYSLYASVIGALAIVISVVEDGCEEAEAEATERAEKLARGQRVHGFMVNLVLNVISLLIIFLGWWVSGGYKNKEGLRFNLPVFLLIFVDAISVFKILMSVVYTAYYFQCMEYHGHKIHIQLPPGILNYTPIPFNDIP